MSRYLFLFEGMPHNKRMCLKNKGKIVAHKIKAFSHNILYKVILQRTKTRTTSQLKQQSTIKFLTKPFDLETKGDKRKRTDDLYIQIQFSS